MNIYIGLAPSARRLPGVSSAPRGEGCPAPPPPPSPSSVISHAKQLQPRGTVGAGRRQLLARPSVCRGLHGGRGAAHSSPRAAAAQKTHHEVTDKPPSAGTGGTRRSPPAGGPPATPSSQQDRGTGLCRFTAARHRNNSGSWGGTSGPLHGHGAGVPLGPGVPRGPGCLPAPRAVRLS